MTILNVPHKTRNVTYFVGIVCLMIAGHFLYIEAREILQDAKHRLALWAIKQDAISPRELSEAGYYPASLSKSCMALCNSQENYASTETSARKRQANALANTTKQESGKYRNLETGIKKMASR